jgi:hypothetical protein
VIFETMTQGFIEQHGIRTHACCGIDYNSTTVAKVKSRIEVYLTLLKQLNRNLNMCVLGKIILDRCGMCHSGVKMIFNSKLRS